MPQLGLDIWEGDPNLDEATLKAAGVSFLFIRLNETYGGLRLDYNFLKQWSESAAFLRAPYYVWGPWLTVDQQVNFIIDHLPAGCKTIALDVECDAFTIVPAKVAGDLCETVRRLRSLGLHVIIYSGSWWWNDKHIQVGLPWQSTVDYWWASYPYRFQPDNSRKSISWDALKALVAGWTWDTGGAPGPCQLRQVCSRYILPGTGGINVDVNLFNGTYDQLVTYFGGDAGGGVTPPPIPTPVPQITIINCSYLTAHNQPDLNSATSGYFTVGDITTLLSTQTIAGIKYYQTPRGWINSYYAKVS